MRFRSNKGDMRVQQEPAVALVPGAGQLQGQQGRPRPGHQAPPWGWGKLFLHDNVDLEAESILPKNWERIFA